MRHAIRLSVALFVFTVMGLAASAQTPAAQTSDMDLNLAYEPQEIVDEWDEWFTNPTPQNAFIADFMNQYNVPQQGLYGLTRLETWYWWASHHPYQVTAYMTARDQQNN